MLSIVALVFLNSTIWAMVGGNISPIPSYGLLCLAGLINFGFCLLRSPELEILRLLAGISGSLCLLFALAQAPCLFKLIVFALLVAGSLLCTGQPAPRRVG